jgi:carboxyl-terminal processing protease
MKKTNFILFSILALCLLGGAIYLTACKCPPTAIPTAVPTLTPALIPTPTVGNSQYLHVFEEVWSTVNETFYDPEFGGVDWAAIHDEYKPLIASAEDDGTFYQLLNQMLWELNVSHVGVGPIDAWPSVEPVVWGKGEIGLDVRLLDDQVVITRVEANSPSEKAGLKPGFVVQSIEGIPVEQILAEEDELLSPPHTDAGRIDILTRRLLGMIYGDPGTCVNLAYLDGMDDLHEGCIERIQRPREGYMGGVFPPAYLEFESGRLESGIGYIRFNTFHEDLIPDMVAAVAELKDAPGIIIDLRGNPGGDPTTAEQLAAQFLNGDVSFGSFRIRNGSIPRSVTGTNVYTGPLVVLIDGMSFSGSEYFSSSMQTIDRAVIIGERSPGGLTGMNVESLSNGALLGYPVVQLVTSDGKVLEGYGVIPDITVTLDRSQLLEGFDAQLQAAIDNLVSQTQQSCSTQPPAKGGCCTEVPSGCTVLTVSKGDQVFFGGNDDYITTLRPQ